MKWIMFADEAICPSSEHTFYLHVHHVDGPFSVIMAKLEVRNMLLEPTHEILSETFDKEKSARRRLNQVIAILNNDYVRDVEE